MSTRTQGGFASSSGHSGLEATPLARPRYYETIIDRNWPSEFIPEITNTSIDERLFQCNQVVQFTRAGQVAPWRTYERNQRIIPDQITPDSFCMSICNQAYKAFKFEQEDIRRACDQWPAFETSFLNNSYNMLAEMWRSYVLGAMILETSKRNKGTRAGRSNNINLGTLGAPIVITPQNIITQMSNLKTVLQLARRWVPGQMFIVLPTGFEAIVAETVYAHQLACCNQDGSILVNGMLSDNLFGFKVIMQDLLPPIVDNGAPSGTANYVIAGWAEAYAFAGDIIEAEIRHVDGAFGVQYQMLAIWGGKAIYPDALSVAYWTY